MNIEEDPYFIDDWEAYAALCIKLSHLDLFKKKLSDYIYFLNEPYQKEIKSYCDRRMGDFAKQELMESKGKVYFPD